MPPLPDRTRPGLAPPARALAASIAHLARHATWRTLHPATRERFLESPAPVPLTRLYYRADDGWHAPLYVVPPAPGGAGEPVVLAHAMGSGADAFRYGGGSTLADALAAAGFSVYLLTHRGDRCAIPPGRRASLSFDHIVELDLPAALDRVRDHSGFPRVHWVGHGLGGQLGLAWAGYAAGESLASLVALCAAVRFDTPRTETRTRSLAAALLPSHWVLPSLDSLTLPLVDEEHDLRDRVHPGTSPPARLRGVLRYATEDTTVGMWRQLTLWIRCGSLVGRRGLLDYREALRAARAPLLVVASEGDRICPAEHCQDAASTWGGEDVTTHLLPASYGHLDVLFARDAQEQVFEPVVDWLVHRRRMAWERDVGAARAVRG